MGSQKEGRIRLGVDYRELNAVSRRGAFPMTNVTKIY